VTASSSVRQLVRAVAFGGAEIGDERRYLQDRVRLFTKSMFLILASLYLFLGLAQLVTLPDALAALRRPERLLQLFFLAVIGGAFLYARSGQRSATALHALEGAGTTALCWASSCVVFFIPWAFAPELLGLLVASFWLVLRAAIVPSRALRTAAVGVAALLPLVLMTHYLRPPDPVEIAPYYRFVLSYRVPIWAAIGVVVTALVSHVIYGLQVRVREAMEVGQYTLQHKIGEGGMGIVYQATHRMLRRPTAVKLLPPERAGERAVLRFEREVVQTSRLAHPATVAIYDYGRTPDGVFYYAMEMLDGLTLEALIEQDGPQPPGRVVHILGAVAESLAEAHAAGLVHRDIKPANIMLCHRGGIPDTVKVLDFGLVKDMALAGEAALTHTDTLLGTPLYLPPEAVTAPETVDTRSDLYMLGGTAYHLLTGSPVFRGASVVEICGHHVHSTPERPSERLGRELPPELEELVLELLRKNPRERPESAAAVAERLGQLQPQIGWTRHDAQRWWAARNGSQRGDESLEG
jgi:serine/threonine-protein kinase